MALLGGAIVAVPLTATGQPPGKIVRIGFLGASLAGKSHMTEGFVHGLQDLGYVQGRNVVLEIRDAHGDIGRLPALAAELVALNVDVILAGGTAQALAAMKATRTIPIVVVGAVDPVADGLVHSLARPGGNVTGTSMLAPELAGKRLELLKEAVPAISRVAVLWHPSTLGERTEKDMLKGADAAARALRLRLQFVEARALGDFGRAFSDMTTAHADALTVWTSPTFNTERVRLVELAARNRLPAVYPWSEAVDAGGLMAYGPNPADGFRHAATYVHKILKGAKPGDLPVEQVQKFELVVNLKTARALGLTIPQSVLQRADQVIE
jgi:ABC-type uncharacterized transport system substrate-binding protein